MLNVGITALGTALPHEYIAFKGGRRYRVSGTETHLALLCESAERALSNGGLTFDDIDLIVGACAVGPQPIPCTAALVHEAIAKGRKIPAFDVNSTCTSFITALDIASHYIQSGRHRNVLIVSGDTPSVALNEHERHSFELFGDGAASAVVSPSEKSAILYAAQITDSAFAHLTEIKGGGTSMPSYLFREENRTDYRFHMAGKAALSASVGLVREALDRMEAESGFRLKDIGLIVPHQASAALGHIMRKLDVADERYIDITKEYGNMVSASVPFALDHAVRSGRAKRGDIVLLLGTAAGLSIGTMLIRY
jgi:3-oxoacyl-[acyl-carrier-protein] synthase-3